MSSLSTFGIVHTAISLVAVGAGLAAVARHRRIGTDSGAGKLFIAGTVLSCLTGFFIFAHGGFGKPHALGILTLIVLAFAWLTGRYRWFGRASVAVETVAYSATLFLHAIPGVTESFTRLPLGSPLASSAEDPLVAALVGVFFVIFLIGAFLQVRGLRGAGNGANMLSAKPHH